VVDFTICPNTNSLRIVITLTYLYGDEFPNRNSGNLQQIKDTTFWPAVVVVVVVAIFHVAYCKPKCWQYMC